MSYFLPRQTLQPSHLIMSPFYLVPVLALVGAFLVLFIFRALWNSTFPGLFGWPQITLWTAFKILLICYILFGFKFPFGYGNSFTKTDSNGSSTTFWSIGSVPSK